MKIKEEVKKPEDQRFYRILAIFLGISAINSQCWDWYSLPRSFVFRAQRVVVFICMPLAGMSQITYLCLNYRYYDVVQLSMIFIITLVTIVTAIKTTKAQTNGFKTAMRDFMSKIHIYNIYSIDKEEYSKKVLLTVEKITRWTFFVFYALSVIGSCGFQLVTITHSIEKMEQVINKTTQLELLIHFWFPKIEYEYNVKLWVVLQLVMFYCGIATVSVFGLFDSLNLAFLYHIIGHINILKHQIINFDMCNMSHKEIKDNIAKISRYYVFIQECIKSAEVAFGLNAVTVYFHNLVGGGLFIYQITLPGNDFAAIFSYSLMVPLFMGIMVVLSLALENISIAADNISDLVYCLKWESMSIPNQKLMLMLLIQVQTPLEFKASFDIKTGMQPAINIIKTAFSYYVMIKTL